MFTKILTLKLPIKLLAALISLSSLPGHASFFDIQNSSNGSRISYNPAHGPDTLLPATAVNGISYNRFGQFQLSGKNLIIYNGPATAEATSGHAAKTIVIAADSISLASEIQIIGAPADLVFLLQNHTPSVAKTISCNQCKFSNAGRITIAAANLQESVFRSQRSIATLNTINNSLINLHNFSAPGAQSVELLANSITVTGTMDTNLRGVQHPQGGMAVTEDGNQVISAGGVSFYPGLQIVNYENLAVSGVGEVQTGVLNIQGRINAATIAAFSPVHVQVSAGAVLNTHSDAIATSSRNGSFYAPIEGIMLQTVKNPAAAIHIAGELNSQKIISLKSYADLISTGRIIASDVIFLARNKIEHTGFTSSQTMGIAGNYIFNSGEIDSGSINIESENDIQNAFGGKISANTFTAVTTDGIFQNGSRSNQFFLNAKKALITPSLEETKTKHGLYQKISETGIEKSNIAASISANKINISALAIENINPYFIAKPSSVDWNLGIKVNNQQARQVSILAESELNLKAKHYLLNSSAILGLNQSGILDINSPVVHNERYRLEADSFIVSTANYSPDKKRSDEQITIGNETKIKVYSPPGRLFSFGKIRVSDGIENNSIDEKFTNAFSYFEVFQDAHFHQSIVKSVGMELTKKVTVNDISSATSCFAYGYCKGDTQTTLAEAETLFSVQGSIYGVDVNVPSASDLIISNINIYNATIIGLVNKYLEQFNYKESEYVYSYVTKSEIISGVLSGNTKSCNGFQYIHYINKPTPNCKFDTFSIAIATLLNQHTSNNEVGSSGLTDVQIISAAKKYIDTIPFKVGAHPMGPAAMHTPSKTGYALANYALLPDDNISINYISRGDFATPGTGRGSMYFSYEFNVQISLAKLKEYL
jgi:hypothetical protein